MTTATDDISPPPVRPGSPHGHRRSRHPQHQHPTRKDALRQPGSPPGTPGRQPRLNDRIDNLNTRIDRVFYAVIAMGAGIIVTLVGGFVGLIIRLG